MTDLEAVQSYFTTPEAVLYRYSSLVRDGEVFPCTPEEISAIICRVNDGSINRDGAKVVMDVLQRRNRLFIEAVNSMKDLYGSSIC